MDQPCGQERRRRARAAFDEQVLDIAHRGDGGGRGQGAPAGGRIAASRPALRAAWFHAGRRTSARRIGAQRAAAHKNGMAFARMAWVCARAASPL